LRGQLVSEMTMR